MPHDGQQQRRRLRRTTGWPTVALLAVLAAAAQAAYAQFVPPRPDFGWTGFYIGGGYDPFGLAASPDLFIFEARAGANYRAGGLLLGIEVNAAAGLPGPRFTLDLAARAGFVFGRRDRALYYAEGGAGWLDGVPVWIAAFGHEFAVDDAVTLMGEVRALTGFDGTSRGFSVQLGVNWHPGN